MKNSPTYERMAAMDQMFYACDHDAAHRSCGIGVYVLDRTPTWKAVEYTIERVSREIARFRQRVVAPTLEVGPAYWVVDPEFDIRYHLRRVQLPEGSSLRAVLDRLEIELMSPIDFERPLWYMMLFEGLEGGKSVLALRASHCLGDGMGSHKMLPVLFDSSRRARRRPMPPAPAGELLTPAEVDAKIRSELPRAALGGMRGIAASAGKLGSRLRQPKAAAAEVRELVEAVRGGDKKEAATSPLFTERSLSRRVTWLELAISDLKRAAGAVEASVNDLYLAGICGMLRHYHEALNTPIDRLTAGIAISIRAEGNGKSAGNQFTSGMVDLPVSEVDIVQRIQDIQGQVKRARRDGARFNILGAVAQVVGYLPPGTVLRLMDMMPLPAIQASNIPGPKEEMYFCGARVERMIGIGPTSGGVFLAGLTAHGDAGTVGITYDPAAIRDGELFHNSLERSFAEVLALAPRTRAKKTGGKAARTPRRKKA